MAGVIAHEYPGPLPKLVAYGLASLVSYSRIRRRAAFPGGCLCRQHCGQPDRPAGIHPVTTIRNWEAIHGAIGDVLRGDGQASPQNQGSPYVPLDSWVYPALDRLAGFGLVDSGFAGMRPWTRRECARLLSEAENSPAYEAHDNEVTAGIVGALEREFRPESREPTTPAEERSAWSLCTAGLGYISGTPLRDGYHFAQTQINDFGRPYGGGWNTARRLFDICHGRPLDGLFPWRMADFVWLAGAVPDGAANDSQVDHLPNASARIGQPAVSQFQVLDAYVG